VDLELHQLDLRYEKLRRRAPEREKRLLASLAQAGQQMPIVVVAGDGAQRVVVDGYKRIRALRSLKADTVIAVVWDLSEVDALLLERLMRCAEGDGPLEQGWLIQELRARFALTHEELGRRFDKSQSWVSRRLALVQELPAEIQSKVRDGLLVPHAAMKYLVPMARAKRADALRLVEALGGRPPTSRQMAAIYGAWLSGNRKTRDLLLTDPWLFLRAQDEVRRDEKIAPSSAQQLLGDFGAIAGMSRKTLARLRHGLARSLQGPEREEVRRCQSQAQADAEALFALSEKELTDA
jgi:ParB family transcriptional regulator, chromosome partitioning protein